MLVRDTSTQTILSDVNDRLTLATFKIYNGIVLITQSNVAIPFIVSIAINERGITSITSLLSFGKANKNFIEITNKHFKQANTFKKI